MCVCVCVCVCVWVCTFVCVCVCVCVLQKKTQSYKNLTENFQRYLIWKSTFEMLAKPVFARDEKGIAISDIWYELNFPLNIHPPFRKTRQSILQTSSPHCTWRESSSCSKMLWVPNEIPRVIFRNSSYWKVRILFSPSSDHKDKCPLVWPLWEITMA